MTTTEFLRTNNAEAGDWLLLIYGEDCKAVYQLALIDGQMVGVNDRELHNLVCAQQNVTKRALFRTKELWTAEFWQEHGDFLMASGLTANYFPTHIQLIAVAEEKPQKRNDGHDYMRLYREVEQRAEAAEKERDELRKEVEDHRRHVSTMMRRERAARGVLHRFKNELKGFFVEPDEQEIEKIEDAATSQTFRDADTVAQECCEASGEGGQNWAGPHEENAEELPGARDTPAGLPRNCPEMVDRKEVKQDAVRQCVAALVRCARGHKDAARWGETIHRYVDQAVAWKQERQ